MDKLHVRKHNNVLTSMNISCVQQLESKMNEPEDKAYVYKKELEKLREQQEKIQHRIEELELMQDDPHEEPYHPVRNMCLRVFCVCMCVYIYIYI